MSRSTFFALGVLGALFSQSLPAAVISTLPGLNNIRIYEVTSIVTPYTLASGATAMNTRLAGTLGSGNSDFTGAPNEFYDAFYSNADGTFNVLGEYITIEAAYTGSGAGLNISEVELVFSGPSPLANNFATGVISQVFGANAANAASLLNIGDNNTNTTTLMGNNPSAADRMRITVGFDEPQTSGVPEPSTYAIVGAALAGLAAKRYKR